MGEREPLDERAPRNRRCGRHRLPIAEQPGGQALRKLGRHRLPDLWVGLVEATEATKLTGVDAWDSQPPETFGEGLEQPFPVGGPVGPRELVPRDVAPDEPVAQGQADVHGARRVLRHARMHRHDGMHQGLEVEFGLSGLSVGQVGPPGEVHESSA